MHLSFESWLQFVTTAVAVFAFVVSVYSTRRRDIDRRINAVETQAESADRRLVVVETQLDALPAEKDLHQLQLAITGLGGELKALHQTFEGHVKLLNRVDASLERHDQFLMDHK